MPLQTAGVQEVKVIGLDIPFGDVFVLALKWVIACILIGAFLGLIYYAYHVLTYDPNAAAVNDAIKKMQDALHADSVRKGLTY